MFPLASVVGYSSKSAFGSVIVSRSVPVELNTMTLPGPDPGVVAFVTMMSPFIATVTPLGNEPVSGIVSLG
jgi:hypothetical protein